jgi:kynurenine formamidase
MTQMITSPGPFMGLASARIVQLGHELQPGQTANGSAPPYCHALTNHFEHHHGQIPGQSPDIAGVSDMFALGCHTGTHIDSLAHISFEGKLFDGTPVNADGVQDDFRGIQMKTMENFRPIVARGVLLDFAKFLGVDRVPGKYVVTVEAMHDCAKAQGATFGRGDVVLFRMGYDKYYRDKNVYLKMPMPGPGPEAARALVAAGVVATGSDTMPYEAAPGDDPLLVHAELIPKGGVFIMEMLDLRELAASGEHEFLFVALPLRIQGGTGSPINPIAILRGKA